MRGPSTGLTTFSPEQQVDSPIGTARLCSPSAGELFVKLCVPGPLLPALDRPLTLLAPLPFTE